MPALACAAKAGTQTASRGHGTPLRDPATAPCRWYPDLRPPVPERATASQTPVMSMPGLHHTGPTPVPCTPKKTQCPCTEGNSLSVDLHQYTAPPTTYILYIGVACIRRPASEYLRLFSPARVRCGDHAPGHWAAATAHWGCPNPCWTDLMPRPSRAAGRAPRPDVLVAGRSRRQDRQPPGHTIFPYTERNRTCASPPPSS